MVKHHTHLLEERLFECYLAESAGDPMDPRVGEHLADCQPCAARYAELTAFMEGLRSDGNAEVDEIFTPDRLRVQLQQIRRRLEQTARPAQVISFPGRFGSTANRMRARGATRMVPPRWIAAAAAAGLFVGVAVGASYQNSFRTRVFEQRLARQTTASPRFGPVATRDSAMSPATVDEAFLSDLEVAMARPHTRELLAFDALTPHVREIRNIP
jgi:anti-sigma factor RsiW